MLDAVLTGVYLTVGTVLLGLLVWLYVWSLRDTLRRLERVRKIDRWTKRHPRVS